MFSSCELFVIMFGWYHHSLINNKTVGNVLNFEKLEIIEMNLEKVIKNITIDVNIIKLKLIKLF